MAAAPAPVTSHLQITRFRVQLAFQRVGSGANPEWDALIEAVGAAAPNASVQIAPGGAASGSGDALRATTRSHPYAGGALRAHTPGEASLPTRPSSDAPRAPTSPHPEASGDAPRAHTSGEAAPPTRTSSDAPRAPTSPQPQASGDAARAQTPREASPPTRANSRLPFTIASEKLRGSKILRSIRKPIVKRGIAFVEEVSGRREGYGESCEQFSSSLILRAHADSPMGYDLTRDLGSTSLPKGQGDVYYITGEGVAAVPWVPAPEGIAFVPRILFPSPVQIGVFSIRSGWPGQRIIRNELNTAFVYSFLPEDCDVTP